MIAEYWKNHYQAASLEPGASLLKQVGKTFNGVDVSEEQLRIIIKSIEKKCRLGRNDTVLDLCCGNGLLTIQIAYQVKSVIGVDFSPGLIGAARKYSASANVSYICKNILELDKEVFAKADKIIMYEALQHFSTEGFRNIVRTLQKASDNACVLIASVPDIEKIAKFYDTDEKMAFYKRRELENKPHVGRWWEKSEIREIAQDHGYSAKFLDQDSRLYTSHYRFDVLMENSK